MSTFYGVSSDSVSTLFGSLSNSSSVSTGQTANILSDYYSIKNGSYKKLLTAYYNKYGDDSIVNKTTSNSTSVDSAKKIADIQSGSENLSNSAATLLEKGSKSLFNKDLSEIYKGVKDFVDDYNSLINSAGTSNVSTIAKQTSNLENYSDKNEKLLNEIGITINKDKTLSIDEAAFKKADMSTVKSIFNDAGSFGYNAATKASQINASATLEATKTGTYTNSGSYSSMTSGNLYDSLF